MTDHHIDIIETTNVFSQPDNRWLNNLCYTSKSGKQASPIYGPNALHYFYHDDLNNLNLK